ncbi:MAG TPA: DUF2723 domain-containing protein [Anaerolineae bacterium]|nr:DUF2723 domain-containing protein [Anaerolineae bacterium]
MLSSRDHTPNAPRYTLLALGVFVAALVVYMLTLAPGLLWGGGDFATFQTKAYTGQIESNIFGHPLWVILARPFIALPIRDVAYRANMASAVFGAAALAFVYLSAWQITRSLGASLLATSALGVSHTFWTYAVMPKPYSLNALLLAACVYFLLRWRDTRRGLYLYFFAAIYGLSLLNHLVLLTSAAGFFVYIWLVARQPTDHASVRRQIALAVFIYVAALAPYLLLILGAGQAEGTGGSIGLFLRGFFTALTSPAALVLGLGAGIVLLLYQFFLVAPIGLIGLRKSWALDRPAAFLLSLIALGDVAFLLGATDPRTGGDYVWNLHYYLQLYVVFALWSAIGFARLWPRLSQGRLHLVFSMLLVAVLPIGVYAVAPALARPFTANLPGFRELGGRDNLAYVLSPWKHTETGARTFGESILATLPPHAFFFADYGIWTLIHYLQVVERARPDVTLVQLPGVDSGQQLPLILAHRDAGLLFLGDVNRYYDLAAIQAHFDVVAAGPIYRLTPK